MEDSTSNTNGARSPRKTPAKKASAKAPTKTAKKPAKPQQTPAANAPRTPKTAANAPRTPKTATTAPRIPKTRPMLPAEEPLLPQLESLLAEATPAERPGQHTVEDTVGQAATVVERAVEQAVAEVAAGPAATTVAENAAEKVEKPDLPMGHIPLWAHLVADPGYAAEHAARQVVRRLGPSAREWVLRTTARYPGASPDALARLAAVEASRSGWRRAAGSAVAGGLGSLATTGFLAHSRTRLVLTIAGAYGFDPADDDRAIDVLTLLRVPRLTQRTTAALRNAGRIMAGIATRGVAARMLPFGAALAAAVQATTGVDDVALRAQAYYRDYKNGKRSFSSV
jgi:hypothetical protein